MEKTKFYIYLLIAAICLTFCSAALADQEGNDRWCNSDQYGCWITGDDAGQSYIMFWSESARDLFMGPGSSAGVVKQYPAGKMPLDPAPEPAPAAAEPAPVNPEEPEDPEEDVTEEQKVDAIVNYVLENNLFSKAGYPVSKEECDEAVKYAKTRDGFSTAVDKVYNMISKNKEKTQIEDAISIFISPQEM